MEEIELMNCLRSERPDVYQHCKRTAHWSHKLAIAMDYPLDVAEDIRHAAEIHDIGKICVPSSILNKPGKLTQIETNVVNSHTNVCILDCFGFRSELNRYVAGNHHRHYSEISKECAIVSVADVFDALTSKRSYREPASPEDALMIMKINPRNDNLDPEIISILSNLITSPKLIFQRAESPF